MAISQAPLRSFAERLDYLMRARRLPQIKVAKDIGVSQANLSRWLSGTIPEMKFAMALAKRLDVSTEWLLLGTGHQPTRIEAFLSEIRNVQIPHVEAQIQQALSNKKIDADITKALIPSLREAKAKYERMIEFIEKHGEEALPAEYLEEEKIYEKRRLKRDAEYWRTRAAEAMGLSPGLTDDELETAARDFMIRAKEVGHVRAAVENLRKLRDSQKRTK